MGVSKREFITVGGIAEDGFWWQYTGFFFVFDDTHTHMQQLTRRNKKQRKGMVAASIEAYPCPAYTWHF